MYAAYARSWAAILSSTRPIHHADSARRSTSSGESGRIAWALLSVSNASCQEWRENAFRPASRSSSPAGVAAVGAATASERASADARNASAN